MHLDKLQITTFRCFNGYEIEFAPGVTILFGKNGAGKSTLIHAIHKALSFIFKRNTKDEDGFDLTVGFPELKVEQYTKTDGKRNWKTGLLYPSIDIKANGSFLGTELEWNMYASTSTFNLQPSRYAQAHKEVVAKVNETNVLPFIAYYSDSFPHIPKSKSITEQQEGLRNLGYLDWNQESACSELWISRLDQRCELWERADRKMQREEQALRNCEVFLQQGVVTKEEYDEDVRLHHGKLQEVLNERNKYDKEISEIRNCLINFSKGDGNYEVIDIFSSIYKGEGLCVQTSQRNNPSFHKLPAGYKRLFYIVLDIAYRSFILNGTTDARGVVIIDEIDLHLHPELEKVVLPRLMRTFPNVQFIVSTHSPLVLTGLSTVGQKNIIYRMEADQNAPTPMFDIYGLDLNNGMQLVMGVNPSDDELNRWISRCAYMLHMGFNEQAANLRNMIIGKKVLSAEEIDARIRKELETTGHEKD